MSRLADRVALVTGAARGLGEAIAERLLAEGANVAICDVDEAALKETAARFRATCSVSRILATTTDVSDATAVAALVTQIEKTWGRLDMLVNNAGIADFSPF